MKFQSIAIDQFGVLQETKFPGLDGGLNVFYGTHGSGKTTWLQFVRGLFSGSSQSHWSGFLPQGGHEPRGGSIHLQSAGRLMRLTRSACSESLQAVFIPDSREPTPLGDVPPRIRTELVSRIFTASGSEQSAINRLLDQALADDIPLVNTGEKPSRLNQAASDVYRECTALRSETGEGRVAELSEQREQMQAEIHRLTEELRRRCNSWESQCQTRSCGADQEQAQVTWLRQELAAAQCDLREAEDRAWSRPSVNPAVQEILESLRPPASPATPPQYGHLQVKRIPQLKQFERRIDHLRLLLAEAAEARLDLNLRAARIAGSDDTATGLFLSHMRECIASLEAGVLELHESTEGLSEECRAGTCACRQWEMNSREVVRDFEKQVSKLCEEVSRHELNYEKRLLDGALATLDDGEDLLRRHLEALSAERKALLDSSAGLRAWSAAQRVPVERDQCRCLNHAHLAGRSKRPRRSTETTTPNQEPPDRLRPTRDDLIRLRRRCDDLRNELEAAAVRWRDTRKQRSVMTLPEDLQGLERDIDEKRIELGLMESTLADHQQRWQVLSTTGEVIRRVVQRFEQDQQTEVVRWASQYLNRLTTGRLVELGVAPEEDTVTVVDSDGHRIQTTALRRDVQSQVELSLRLALVCAYQERGDRFPLVLDDILSDTDPKHCRAAVELLNEFAEQQDQQIIYLTGHAHLAELFERHGAAVRTMPGSNRLSYREVTGSEQPAGAIRGWVDRKSSSEVIPAEPTTFERPLPVRQIEAPSSETNTQSVRLLKPLKRRQPDGPYWLSLDTPIELVPSIGAQMGRRLAGLGVGTTGELIDLDVETFPLRLACLQITPERLSDWQAEAKLLCCVPDLTGPDAQRLAACGIVDADALSQADADQLLIQISAMSDDERLRSHQVAPLDRHVVQRWIHNSRRARRLQEARRLSRSRRRTGRGSRRSGSVSGRRSPATIRSSRVRRRKPRLDRSSAPTSTLLHQAQESETLIKPFVPVEPPAQGNADSVKLTFYLSPHSPVVEAPSIGPTTSRRLEKIGILTVADLLHRDAGETAERLNNRRIKEKTVQLWQRQARLMCRIPQLRGHDAQVLIACDVTEPEQLAQMEPSELFAAIEPFVNSKEGRRLLRSSSTPDLDEVADWINWSRHSRHLRAA